MRIAYLSASRVRRAMPGRSSSTAQLGRSHQSPTFGLGRPAKEVTGPVPGLVSQRMLGGPFVAHHRCNGQPALGFARTPYDGDPLTPLARQLHRPLRRCLQLPGPGRLPVVWIHGLHPLKWGKSYTAPGLPGTFSHFLADPPAQDVDGQSRQIPRSSRIRPRLARRRITFQPGARTGTSTEGRGCQSTSENGLSCAVGQRHGPFAHCRTVPTEEKRNRARQ